VLALVVVGAGPLFGARHFFYRDVSRQYEATAARLVAARAAHELPLWNPATQSGIPLWANLHAGAVAPHVVLTTSLPFSVGYAWAVLLALVALGVGSERLLRHFVPAASATWGAVVITLSGLVLGATSYLPLLVGVACIPWQAATLLHDPRLKALHSIPLALLFAVQLLEGDPSTAVMGALISLALAPRRVLALVGSGVIALGLSAVVILPAWDLLHDSTRATSALDTRLGWSLHPARLVEWAVRLPWGALMHAPFFDRYELARGPDAQPFFLDQGLGVVAALLVPVALFTRGRLRAAGLALMGAGLLLSLGRHVADGALHTLPPFSMFRFPERWAVLTLFGAGLLTAHAAAAIWANPRHLRTLGAWSLVVALAAVALGAAALFPSTRGLITLGCTAALVGSSALLLRSRVVAALCLVAGAAVDGHHAVSESVMTVAAQPVSAAASVETMKQRGGRVWRDNSSLRAAELPPRGEAAFAAELTSNVRTFASGVATLQGVDELRGYSPVYLRHWELVLRTFAQRHDVLFRVFDVCWVVAAPDKTWASRTPPVAVEALSPQATLYRYDACGGRAWAAQEVVAVPTHEAALKAMEAPTFDPLHTAIVEADFAGRMAPTRAEVRLTRTSPGVIELDVEGTGPRFVVVSETFAPGWQVEVDGQASQVLRVDGAVMGVLLTDAHRHVTLRYVEPSLVTGAFISGATVLLVLALWRRSR
jgi:hypothetical protein